MKGAMRIAITGSTGLIGTTLVRELRSEGHTVTRIVRAETTVPGTSTSGPGGGGAGGTESGTAPEEAIQWDPEEGTIEVTALEGHDAIVHLAGESIAGLWTQRKRAAIYGSRVRGTTLLAETIARLDRPPAVFVSASAVGFYGDRPGPETVDEETGPGTDFLAETTVAWENATEAARAAGVRVVPLRFGLVLSRDGGLLHAMLPAFRIGLGARLGSGEQPMPWVALPDVLGAIRHVIAHDTLNGPVNVVAPGLVTNTEFTRELARAVRRPALFRVPAFLLRTILRDQADVMLLGGARVVPQRLHDSGYVFRYPQLDSALRALL